MDSPASKICRVFRADTYSAGLFRFYTDGGQLRYALLSAGLARVRAGHEYTRRIGQRQHDDNRHEQYVLGRHEQNAGHHRGVRHSRLGDMDRQPVRFAHTGVHAAGEHRVRHLQRGRHVDAHAGNVQARGRQRGHP